MTPFEKLIQPDLFRWEQLQSSLEPIQLEPGFIDQLQTLALGSSYAINQLAKYPGILLSLQQLRQFGLESDLLVDRLRDITDIAEIKRQLRLFRHRKLVQIIYLDICRNEAVENTLLHLSELADLLIEQARSKAEQILSSKHGQPLDSEGEVMQLNVIGMGKLGGRELNFSSDIDLICCYSEDGQLKGFGQQTYNQFYTQVVRMFKDLLHDSTADGFVYRVDLRLRPWGDSGPVVLSHGAFEHYYQLHGREWEQYAMVKARVVTGTDSDRRYLQSILQPFVYRRYHDYRVFDGLAQLKHKINQQAKRKGSHNNVKTGPGGIREIEFFVQAFQILKGGRNHQLQTPSLLQAIEVLLQQEISDRKTLKDMRESYCFLRMLENRIQMLNDQQTHELPTNENQQARIAYLLNYPDWSHLQEDWEQHTLRVNQEFSTLFTTQDDAQQSKASQLHLDDMPEEQHLDTIRDMGFANAEQIHQLLLKFYRSKALLFMSDKAKKRFHCFFPPLLKLVSAHPQQLPLLEKMLALMSSIAGRSIYFELLYQNMPLLQKLVEIFASSEWIASEVTQHPMLLESLLYPEHLAERFDKDILRRELEVQLNNVSGDVEMELDILRQFKRAQTIEVATAEIAEEITTDQVSWHLAELAEILLQAIYGLCWREFVEQYGEPVFEVDAKHMTAGMGIIAYGKLGGHELHYQSDLDIIFLHNSWGQRQQTRGDADGKRVIENATFFARLAQKIISKITLLTAAGKLYEIDTRLRPDGASGMLVSSLTSFEQYQLAKAWVWEHQAIIRARHIAGNPVVKTSFDDIRHRVLASERNAQELAEEIIRMRDKMHQAINPVEGDQVNIKHSRGGMVDIEFMVQYWVLRHANKFASLCETTDNIGLISKLHQLGLIPDDCLSLRDCYQTFHKLLHAQVLQNQSAEIAIEHVQYEFDLVKACWQKTFNNIR